VTIPLLTRVLSNGAPLPNTTVNYTVVKGTGTLSEPSAQSNPNGYASVIATVPQVSGLVEVSACVGQAGTPCQDFYLNPVPLSQLNLEEVLGAGQVSPGLGFQPIVVRVTDSASTPDPVLGATVAFQTTVLRPGGSSSAGSSGETNPTNPAMPVILNVSQTSVASDINGLASITPSSAGFTGPLEVDVAVTAGTSAALDYPLELLPAASAGAPVAALPKPIVRAPAAVPPRPAQLRTPECPLH